MFISIGLLISVLGAYLSWTLLAAEALALMSDPLPMVTVLFVIDGGKPVGILRIHDLIRAGV